ncbi:hypothetical protein [Streptomyces sp. CAU 1734]|uniref:hypothetical protein n=1 Tax=Streptomyces sp. CAU 1734 TaxID=3140360 RepID=UPI00326180A0
MSPVAGSGLPAGLLAGGVPADRRGRKGLILAGGGWAVVTSAALSLNAAAGHPRVWIVRVPAVDLCAALFATPAALHPQLAGERHGSGTELAGVLTAAPVIGAAVASVTSGWTGRTARPGRVLFGAVAACGPACPGSGPSPVLGFGPVLLAIGGFAGTVFEILRRTLLMRNTPGHLHGRSAVRGSPRR